MNQQHRGLVPGGTKGSEPAPHNYPKGPKPAAPKGGRPLTKPGGNPTK